MQRTLQTPTATKEVSFIDLGGQAVHVFRFPTEPDLAYEYFCDVAAVFRLLPDTLDVWSYAPNRYRLIVGATDGHGHAMSAIFDLQALHEPGRSIRMLPADDGPPVNMPGIVFSGTLAAEAIFYAETHGSSVEYTVEIDMSIPVPSMLRLMPQHFLQSLGEKAMEFKMAQMISGFARDITADFHAWISG